ncbi:MAG: putative hydroxymethylpyrimidine transporter CytX [Spirochaetaceae bacterium]|nr:putative hydroxymethylpyrimidine transporter CytX [Spirochaetaceae bacterium]
MGKSKKSILSSSLLMFGAGVSIAEILTGTMLSPLGLKNGIIAIILGHLIGAILLFLIGVIGSDTSKSSMESVKLSFGSKGGIFFSSLNILQLVGWTGIMIISGSMAANSIIPLSLSVWSLIIGILIIAWVMIGIKDISKINIVAMSLLLILTIILSKVIFSPNTVNTSIISKESLSFGLAVELSAAMPLSWLPLIADYTREDKGNWSGAFFASVTYTFISMWMYLIGLGAAIFTGKVDIAQIMMSSNLGLPALLIVVLSTVTTTFLDVYSSGISSVSINTKLNEKTVAIIVATIGILLAIFTPIASFEGFLYLIGSVFAPMAAIMISDYFILHKDHSCQRFDVSNSILWILGFIIYRISLNYETVLGNTLPVMIIIILISLITNKITLRVKSLSTEQI